MKTKLTKKEIFISILTTCVSFGVVMAVLFLMVLINLVNTGIGLNEFITTQYKNVITVAVAVALLTGIVYVYMFFENKSLLAQYSKIVEIYLLLCVALLLCNVVGKFINSTARPLLFFALMSAMVLRRKDAIFMNIVFALMIFIFNRFLNSADVTLGQDMPVGSIKMVESFASMLTCFCCGIIGIIILKRIKTRIGCVMLAIVLLGPVI